MKHVRDADLQMDIAFLRPENHLYQGIKIQLLNSEPLVAALPSSHALAQHDGNIDLAMLNAEEFILTPPSAGRSLREATIKACVHAGFEPRLGTPAPHIVSILTLVSAEMGVSLVPASIALMNGMDVTFRGLKEGVPVIGLAAAWSESNFSIPAQNFLHQLLASRALLGVVEAPLPLGITSTINRWFPPREKGTASGIFLAAAKFGPVIVPPACAAIAAIWGWREIFYIFAVPGILLSVVWFIFITKTPAESKHVNEAELNHINSDERAQRTEAVPASEVKAFPVLDRFIRVRNEKPLTTSKAVFRSWNVIGSGIGYCFQVGITNVLMAWIPTWLLTVKHFSLMDMGIVASAPWVGAVVGNLLGGILSDTVLGGRRKPGMIISALATCVMMGLIVAIPGGALYYGFMLFITGILLCIGYSNYMTYPMGVVSKDKYPMACAIVNTAGQLGGSAAPLAMGYILDVAGWDAGFIFLAVISLMTFVVLMTMTEPLKTRKPSSSA